MSRPPLLLILLASLVALLPSACLAQPTYSVDFKGPTGAAPLFGGGFVTDGDILTPAAAPGPPIVVAPAGAAGLGLFPTPILGGSHGGAEVDALSYGFDPPLSDDPIKFSAVWEFSVDEFAVGFPALPPAPGPTVTSEGANAFFGGPGLSEAAADVFAARTSPPLFTLPIPGINAGVGIFDGDGFDLFGRPGLNLIEPNPPTPFAPANPGDNLDAWDGDTPVGVSPVYFSLDSNSVLGGFPPFPIDPLEGPPVNTGSAAANGFVGGDVLVAPFGGAPGVYAPAPLLGLDDIAGPDTDDLDALVLYENGDGAYTPPKGPFDWVFDPTVDMLLYSVRRGSAIIGVPDALFGIPITEGDVLIGVIDPLDGIPLQDGIDGDVDVGIFTFAEDLGLGTDTSRSGTGSIAWGPYGAINPITGADDWSDDLDALDVRRVANSADSDFDGDVDIADLLVLQRNFGLIGPFLTEADGEFSGDQIVDTTDRLIWEAQFGIGAMPVATATLAPEPTGLFLFLGLGAFVAHRQRR